MLGGKNPVYSKYRKAQKPMKQYKTQYSSQKPLLYKMWKYAASFKTQPGNSLAVH